MIRRAVVVALLALGLLGAGPALGAAAAPGATTAVSAVPPASRMFRANLSSLDCVRPARKTVAPSPANASATAVPTGPPAP